MSSLEKLYDLFFVDLYNDFKGYDEWEIETFDKINNDLGDALTPNTNQMKAVVDHIYYQDDCIMLEKMLTGKYGFDNEGGSYFSGDWEDSWWTEDNESQQSFEDEYGEEGYNIYHFHTKSMIHIFRQLAPHSEGWDYVESVKSNI